MKIAKHLSVLLLLTALLAHANNPLVPDVGMADPHMYVFNGKLYLFSTRDSSKTAKTFIMPDWHIWTSDDMLTWTHVRTIKPTETWMGESTRCWATETATRNGKYYFYFSNGNESTGVLVANKPEGPYLDVLGKPLLAKDLTPTKEYDPSVLVDDDGQAYIIFGHHRSDDDAFYYMIAKLNKDMVSLAEYPKEVKITGHVGGGVLDGNDKPNLHRKNGMYYLSAGSHYATSTNVYGPYIKRGNSGNGQYGLDAKAHGNYFEWNNQSFHTWCHFYMGKDVARYRESYLAYLHYKDNGEMVDDTDFLNAHFESGVGQYDAKWDLIQAEWYMAADRIAKKEAPNGGFEIQKIKNNASLCYPNMKHLALQKQITFHVSSPKGAIIEIYADKERKVMVGKCKVPPTQNYQTYADVISKIKTPIGSNDLSFVFKGKGEDVLHLDWFKFHR